MNQCGQGRNRFAYLGKRNGSPSISPFDNKFMLLCGDCETLSSHWLQNYKNIEELFSWSVYF